MLFLLSYVKLTFETTRKFEIVGIGVCKLGRVEEMRRGAFVRPAVACVSAAAQHFFDASQFPGLRMEKSRKFRTKLAFQNLCLHI